MYTLPSSTASDATPIAWQKIRRFVPLSVVVLLHVGFFYALQSGLLQHAAKLLPNEVFATLIAPEAVRADLPQPVSAPPKAVQVVQRAVTPPAPQPVVNNTPSPQAISAPPPPSAAAEPAAVAAPSVAASAPAATAPALPKTITSGIEYIQAPQAEYPLLSKRMGETGKVILRVLVNEKGRAEQVQIQKTSGSARLDEAARQAMLRAIFKPYMEDGKAVAVYAIAPIAFNLDR